MKRREFIGMTSASIAAGAMAGFLPGSVASAAPGVDDSAPLDAAAYRATRKFAETRFGRIAYLERGAGDAALFLHGFTLNGFQWRGAIERLSLHRRCIAPDFMGMGYTEVAEHQGLAPEDQVAMIVAFLDTLSIPAVDLVASDSGGMVAQLLVVHHAERVRSLLLANCDTEIDCPPRMLLQTIELAKAGAFSEQVLGAWLADKELARSPEGIGGLAYADPTHPTDEAIEYYFAPLVSTPQRRAQTEAFTIALERNALLGIEQALQRSQVPVRVVWGMADSVFLPENIYYLDRVLGSSLGVRRLDDCKLFWPEERPDIVADEATRLWAAARKGSA
jgi:haloalkane dehalogenase